MPLYIQKQETGCRQLFTIVCIWRCFENKRKKKCKLSSLFWHAYLNHLHGSKQNFHVPDSLIKNNQKKKFQYFKDHN